jgi:ligand-binding SRPBCC domain-containing protein
VNSPIDKVWEFYTGVDFKHSFIVNSYIDKVWEFYTDVKHLEIVTPKEMKLKIINATS